VAPTRASLGNGGPSVTTGTDRPTRDFLLLLPYLAVTSNSDIDYAAADPAVLVQLADNAETVMRTIHLGIAVMGQLLARSAPEIELHEISGDAVEALGWLLAELGDLAAVADCIAVPCRRHTADYSPGTIVITPNVRP
jgi:hypothetical protein